MQIRCNFDQDCLRKEIAFLDTFFYNSNNEFEIYFFLFEAINQKEQ